MHFISVIAGNRSVCDFEWSLMMIVKFVTPTIIFFSGHVDIRRNLESGSEIEKLERKHSQLCLYIESIEYITLYTLHVHSRLID